jgi:hypothetical protein
MLTDFIVKFFCFFPHEKESSYFNLLKIFTNETKINEDFFYFSVKGGILSLRIGFRIHRFLEIMDPDSYLPI